MSWKETIDYGEELVLVTCSKDCKPNANVVISKGFIGNKLLINDCQMDRTRKNIEENAAVCVVARKNGEYYRIKGKASVYFEGEYFDIAKERETEYELKSAILVDIGEVFDLDKVEKVL